MTQENEPSVKEVLEDIKKVISGPSASQNVSPPQEQDPTDGDSILKGEVFRDYEEEEEPLDLLDPIEDENHNDSGDGDVKDLKSKIIEPKNVESVKKSEDSNNKIAEKKSVDVLEDIDKALSVASNPQGGLQSTPSIDNKKAPIDDLDIKKSKKDIPVSDSKKSPSSDEKLAEQQKKIDVSIPKKKESEDNPVKMQHSDNQADFSISKESAESTANEIKHLIDQIHSSRKHSGLPIENSITIEEMVMSMIKPELSKWLNINLPRLVKEVVEKEIKNIIEHNL